MVNEEYHVILYERGREDENSKNNIGLSLIALGFVRGAGKTN